MRLRMRLAGDEQHQVVAKPLEDGSIAVGLFNLRESEAKVELFWDELLISGPRHARDLGLRCDAGVFDEHFAAIVPAHGVKLIRLQGVPNPEPAPRG